MHKELHPKLPKYARLSEELREQIVNGDLKPGDRLPSFMEMRTQHGVSQGIMERAYVLLEEDGLVERQPGRGTFVLEPVKRKNTNVIGLVLHICSEWMADAYTMQWMAGVKSEAAKHGLRMHWLNDQEEANISHENLDGVLMYCHPTEALMLNLPPDLPHVLTLFHSPDFNCVVPDDFNGTRLATQHLLSLGHRRIFCFAASDVDSIVQLRVAGYHAALKEAGITPEKKWVRFLTKCPTLSFTKFCELTMNEWLKDDWKELGCTAIVAHNDGAAIGIINALKNHGLRVPEDVSVVGFDGTEQGELCSPPLTSIKVPLQEIGERAVKVLLEQIEGGVGEPRKSVVPVQLKIGESTAPAKSQAHQTVVQ